MDHASSLSSSLLNLRTAATSQEVSSIALEAVRFFCKADGATLVLREGDLCHYADERAISPLWKGSRFLMGSCISGWVMQFNDTAIISDIYKDDRIPKDAYRATFVKSLCMVPVGRSSPVAALGAYWKEETLASPEQVTILLALSNAVFTALQRVQSLHSLSANLNIAISSQEVLTVIETLETAIAAGQSLASLESFRKLGAKLVSRVPFSGVTYSRVDLVSILQSSLGADASFRFDKSPALVSGSATRLSELFATISKVPKLSISLKESGDSFDLTLKGESAFSLSKIELAKLIYLATTHYAAVTFGKDQNVFELSLRFPIAKGFAVDSPALTPLLQGQKILLLTTELSASKDLTSILNSHGAEVVLAQNSLHDFDIALEQKPTVALLYHKAESGGCSFADVIKSLHLAATENIPFVHVTDGSCLETSPLHNRRTIWLNSKTPYFPNTMAYSIAGMLTIT